MSSRRDGPRRPKVCHVVATAEGFTWVVEQLCELRDRYGFDVAVVVPDGHGTLVDRLDAAAIPRHVTDLRLGRGDRIWTPVAKIVALARVLRRERVDVVQTHLFSSMLIGRIAGWLVDVPVRAAMIAGPFHLEAPASRWMDRATCWMESVIMGSCEYILDMYRVMGVPERRLALVYYGADERRWDPATSPRADIRRQFGWTAGTPVVGMVSYFYPRLSVSRWNPPAVHGHGLKGHEDLLRAVPLVLREIPTARFLLVGSGWGEGGDRYLEEMRAMARALGVQERVAFAGYRGDVPGILRELDVSVHPSLTESLDGTIESMLMECPPVATRDTGMVDSVQDGVTGMLVRRADPADLAEGILRLLRDPTRARQLGRAGRARGLERFTLRRTVADLHTQYDRFLGAGRRGHRAWVSAWRLLLAVPVGGYLVLRFAAAEVLLPRLRRPSVRG